MIGESNEEKVIRVYLKSSSETAEFAAEELVRYLRLILGNEKRVELTKEPVVGLSCLRLGLFTDFPERSAPDVADPLWDDAIEIQVDQGEGVIAGNNPRSLLLAVYRFLNEVGCRWVRPGKDGELIPRKLLGDLSATVSEQAAYSHRGLCIEGAVSEENVRAIIEWLPKVGMNAYFIQFRDGFPFFQRWYDHQHNPQQSPANFSSAAACQIVRRLEREIRKRGLLYHAVGHGWTCESLGIPGLGWDQRVAEDAPAEITPYLAQIKGKRQIWRGVPLNTNLCYSKPEVRQRIIAEIIHYLKGNPDIDLLHFWLADGVNNQCECPACCQGCPADFYVQMLNELDAELTMVGLNPRVVFLVYVDLLWPPQKERIKNPGRFSLMFAPTPRSYTQSFTGRREEIPLPEYVRNQLKFPSDIRENLAHLRAWQQVFSGDSFDFDYHLMWAHYFDPGYTTIAEIAYEDIRNLKAIGLNGLISCQVQRAFMPTGLPLAVIARTLWDPNCSFSEIAIDYFSSAFGDDGQRCRQLLAKLPNFMDELNPWSEHSAMIVDGRIVDKLHQVNLVIEELKVLVEANRNISNSCQGQSWKYLGIFLRIYSLFTSILINWAEGQSETALKLWEELNFYICQIEDEVQMVFDVFEFVETMERVLTNLKPTNEYDQSKADGRSYVIG